MSRRLAIISSAALGDVAAGIRGALDASSVSLVFSVASAGIIEIGRKIISMNAEFLSDSAKSHPYYQ